MKRLLSPLIIIISAVTFNASAGIKINDSLSAFGDVRGGYYTLHRDDRDKSDDVTDEFRTRIRIGLKAKINNNLSFTGRFAGRYSTYENNNYFKFFTSIPSSDGLRRGDSTIDLLYLNYAPDEKWNVRVGRMITKFELTGIPKKSLDRSDSPNVDITWTDGAHISYQYDNGWKAHLILQRNLAGGPTTVRRKPLDFHDDDSRISYFVALENNKRWGHVVQRGIDINYLPKSLLTDGTTSGSVDDYWGFVGRMAASWPTPRPGMDFLLGGEFGYAPETPRETTLKTGASGDTGGTAFQISANLMNIRPQHSFGVVYGRVEAGWLLSPDFRNNNTLVEGRYRWAINKKQKLEIRLRRREDLDQLTGSATERVDKDLYVRYTHKF